MSSEESTELWPLTESDWRMLLAFKGTTEGAPMPRAQVVAEAIGLPLLISRSRFTQIVNALDTRAREIQLRIAQAEQARLTGPDIRNANGVAGRLKASSKIIDHAKALQKEIYRYNERFGVVLPANLPDDKPSYGTRDALRTLQLIADHFDFERDVAREDRDIMPKQVSFSGFIREKCGPGFETAFGKPAHIAHDRDGDDDDAYSGPFLVFVQSILSAAGVSKRPSAIFKDMMRGDGSQ